MKSENVFKKALKETLYTNGDVWCFIGILMVELDATDDKTFEQINKLVDNSNK